MAEKKVVNMNLENTLESIGIKSSGLYRERDWPSTVEEEWRRTDLKKYKLESFIIPATVDKHASVTSTLGRDEGICSLHIKKTQASPVQVSIKDPGAGDIVLFGPSLMPSGDTLASRTAAEMAKKLFDSVENKFEYLSLSNYQDSLFLIIPDNLVLEKPLVVEFESLSGTTAFLPNLYISAGNGAKVNVIQKIKAAPASGVSGLLYAEAGEGAELNTVTVGDQNAGSLLFVNRYFRLQKDAVLFDFQSYSDGKLLKSKSEVNLEGPRAEARLAGLAFSRNKTHTDIRTVQRHLAEDCFSDAVIKSIVQDSGRCIYQGLIEVEENARLTDAYLTNKNLVMNDGARADSIPSLKIRNNDVKCSHGSTTGKIDKSQVHYLTSRGIGEEEAKQMILEGFLNELYDRLPSDISAYCSPYLRDKLGRAEAAA